MRVFKFGGASVKDADAVRNVCKIVRSHASDGKPLLVVVSAMGKTTNALERLVHCRLEGKDKELRKQLIEVSRFHLQIAKELFNDTSAPIFNHLKKLFFKLRKTLKKDFDSYDKCYNQIVSFGEITSTRIIAAYLKQQKLSTRWIDARKYIQTNDSRREAKVDWLWTEQLIRTELSDVLKTKIIVSQGFIGGTVENETSTLGREGSDFSAAIFAFCLSAENVTIWKDVDGIMNADPKRVKDTVLLDRISYQEAAEMTYYGASVIHPKTIKPLANKNIPLQVRSFINPEAVGTVIDDYDNEVNTPCIIFKGNQCVLSFHRRNLSSVNENILSHLFGELARDNVKINLTQNSAVSFFLCTNHEKAKISRLTQKLERLFEIEIETGLELITVKHYTESVVKDVLTGKSVVLEQRTGNTFRAVVKGKK